MSAVIWLTGLSGSGKSTIAEALVKALTARGQRAYVLDGDVLREGLNRDLGFSPADRAENIRRSGEVAALLARTELVVVCAFISPYQAGRDGARKAAGATPFIEVFLDVSLEVCEARDPKRLYARARAGEVRSLTGIDAPYERPAAPEIRLDTENSTVSECVQRILEQLA